jgi:hypothetical protein
MGNERLVFGTAAWAVALICVGCRGSSEGAEEGTTGTVAQQVSVSDPVKAAKDKPVKQWTRADDEIISAIWLGDDDKGTLYAPLWRGAFPGVEDYVYAPSDHDCTKAKSTLRIDWNRATNKVDILIKGRAFPRRPDVRRTEGVDWFPDPFHNAPKDIHEGGYRMWMLMGSPTRQAGFFYDPTTLQLKGSDFDFPNGPPPGLIRNAFPVISMSGSTLFDPDSQGFVVHEWKTAYDHVTVESGTYGRAWGTFVPVDLCQAAPLQPGISQLRPYASPWQPLNTAPRWDEMLHAGLGFDIQIDERTDPNDQYGGNLPYVFSGISYLGNMTALQGGVPNGHANSILAAFQNVAPAIFPVPGGNGRDCRPYLHEPHVTAPRFCEGAH